MRFLVFLFFLFLATRDSYAQYGACGNDLTCGDNNSPFYDPYMTPMVRRMDKEKQYQNEQYRQSQEMNLQQEQLDALKKQNQLLEDQNQMLEEQEARMDELESRQSDLEFEE